jgi:serine/threonine protein kinase
MYTFSLTNSNSAESYENLLTCKDVANTTVFDYYIKKKDVSFKNTVYSNKGFSIYEAEWRYVRVCVKEVDNNENTNRELRILSKCIHPKVVQFLGFFKDKDKTSILFEYMENGNLQDYMKEHPVSELRKIEIMLDITKALHYIHNRYPEVVLHRDLKPTNILVNKHGEVKLSDFGISKMVNKRDSSSYHGHSGEKGTYVWMPPEVLNGEYYNFTADIYSLGLLMYYIWTERVPFEEFNVNTMQLMFKKHKGTLFLKDIDNFYELNELILRCTTYDKDSRPDTHEIINKLIYFSDNCTL